jgi:hypothetical protein
MGTRSVTTFIETWKDESGKKRKQVLVTMYRQMDGYPEGMGKDLADYLIKGNLVNGIGFNASKLIQFNGMGCLAASTIAHFKTGSGSIYIVRGKNHGEQYRYEVEGDFDVKNIILRCFEVGYMKGEKYFNGTRKIFDGSPKDFDKFLKKLKKENA